MKEKFTRQWVERVREMRALMDGANGGRLSDEQFAEYRALEDAADNLAGRIANETGQSFGPRLGQELSRTERLESREQFVQTLRAPQHSYGLEGGGDGRRGGGDGEFQNLGEQLRSIVAAGTPGNPVDPRLYTQRAALGMNETIGAEGGFAVAQDFATDLLELTMETAVVAPLCRSFPIAAGRGGLDLPVLDQTSRASGSRLGGVVCAWLGESGTISASKPKLRMLSLKPGKLGGLIYLTSELTEDATALEIFVKQAFAEEMAFSLDDAIIRGSGAGQPLGIINADCLVEVAKESGQVASTFTYNNATDMLARLPAPSARRAVWLINQQLQPQLFRMTAVIKNVAGTENVGGSAVYIPPGGASGAPYGTLLGRPVLICEQASAPGSVGDVLLIDPRKYILATRGNLRVDASIHVAFLSDENALRFILRIDGQPQDKSSVTPYKGSLALSPFVALAERK